MPNLYVFNLLWCLHLFAAAFPAGTPPGEDASVTPFKLDQNGAVVVPVSVGGAGPFPFLVDTGSSHTVIADALMTRLGLSAVAKAAVVSASGQSMRPVVRLESTAVGSAVRDGLLASVLPSDRFIALGADVQGVLGQDFLATFDYTLDYARRELTWKAEAGSGTPAARLSLTPDAGRFLVALPQGAGRGVVRLVPDSGSAALVIFDRRKVSSGALRLMPAEGRARMNGVSGDRIVDRAVVRDLRVGDLVLHNEPAVVVNDGESGGTEADGLLPLHHFARVSFHAREQCLSIWAR
jgi:Aspartyl protease